MTLRTILKLTAASSALLAPPVFAQSTTPSTQSDQPTPSAAAPDAASLGNDIVVTAQRRAQRLQDVPVPVTAFSSADVARLQLDDAFDIAKYVPSTHITQSAFKATATYFIRGVGSLDITSTNDPPITTYENDFIIPRPNANNIGLFDVERIEVLRGPQGTLFGRNTSGGAIDIILKKPKDVLGGYIEGEYGSYSKSRLRASVDLPLSDKVLTKTSGFFLDDPGFIKNITTGERVGGEHNWGVREDVRLLPVEHFTWDLAAEYSRSEGLGFSLRQLGTPAPATDAPPAPVYYEATTGIRQSDCSDPLATWSAGRGGSCSKADSLGLTSTMSMTAGSGSLDFLYGYRQYWATYQFDSTTSAVPIYGAGGLFSDGYGYSHSAELKWTSQALDGRIKYVAGLYALKIVDSNRLSSASYSAATGVKNYTQDIRIKTNTVSLAGYAQADVTIADPLILTLGGRFTHDVKKLAYLPQTQYGAPTISTAQVTALGQPTRLEANRFTPRAALQLKIAPDVSVYVSATNGFKAAGWNGRTNNPAFVVAVQPERAWSYEAGLRSQFFNRRATINLTAFQEDIKGYQNTVQVLLPGQVQVTTLLENIADFRVRGLEYDLRFDLTRSFSWNASGSWMDAKYTKVYPFPGVPASAQLSINEPPTQAPKFQITTGPIYRVALPDNRALTLSGIWRHVSTYQISILNPIRTPVDDFFDANLQVDLSKNLYLGFACTNCSNRKSYMLILRNFVYPVDPRRFTGTIGVRF